MNLKNFLRCLLSDQAAMTPQKKRKKRKMRIQAKKLSITVWDRRKPSAPLIEINTVRIPESFLFSDFDQTIINYHFVDNLWVLIPLVLLLSSLRTFKLGRPTKIELLGSLDFSQTTRNQPTEQVTVGYPLFCTILGFWIYKTRDSYSSFRIWKPNLRS